MINVKKDTSLKKRVCALFRRNDAATELALMLCRPECARTSSYNYIQGMIEFYIGDHGVLAVLTSYSLVK